MRSWSFRSRTFWIMPVVLLVVVLLEEVTTYKVRQHVHPLYPRVAIIMALNAFVFVVGAGWVAPWLRDLLATARKGTKQTAGHLGLWLFYALAYGALFYAFVVLERRGPAGLLPPSLR
ncbi:MAG: hypothetical protein H6708_22065 [Kofleriaceae bacterium]|nr:hypothetical protein [Myxococcales bacterium]MCB9563102.1 hypothetical protein [Kofleriaceae bacterium]